MEGLKEGASWTPPEVVNSRGESLGFFRWELPLGTEVRRGVPSELATYRAEMLRTLVAAAGVERLTTDDIRYLLDGLRHLQVDEQPSAGLIADFGDRIRKAPGEAPQRRRVALLNRVSTRTRRFTRTRGRPTAEEIEEEYSVWEKADDDGTDPRDTPGPVIYGEEIEVDLLVPPVYVVSDFHLGSNRHHKRPSNDMDQRTLRHFIRWLKMVHNESHWAPYYDVVMNGDFLDLWQAARPNNDTYSNRLGDVLDSNSQFIEALAAHLHSHWKCQFHYVIGNHDDPLGDGPHDPSEDPRFDQNSTFDDLRQKVAEKVPRRPVTSFLLPSGREWKHSFFEMKMRFTADRFDMLAEHGHLRDDGENRRGDDGEPADGQGISDQVTMMQETWPDLFRDIESTPGQEMARHLKCLREHPNTPSDALDAIEELKDLAVASQGFWTFVGDAILPDFAASTAAIQALSPRNEREAWKEKAQDAADDGGYKVVVFGHTHLHDLKPLSNGAYANSGTWLDNIRAVRDSTGNCRMQVTEGELPYVKVSKEKDQPNILVELKFFRGSFANQVLRVPMN